MMKMKVWMMVNQTIMMTTMIKYLATMQVDNVDLEDSGVVVDL